jgi:hypothetical protein
LEAFLQSVLTSALLLSLWGILVLLSVAILAYDLKKRNPGIVGLMKAVWIFTVVYSGPIGLLIYWTTGRKQIPRDTVWRRGWRSTAHCYSGCGGGEIVGVVIAAGIMALGNWGIAIITFTLAYIAGFALTAGPLMQEGVPFGQAMKDALYSETASITVMEVVAIGVDLYLAKQAVMSDTLFWSSLVFSLTMGLFAAWPVNVLLVKFGVKKGMHNPRDRAKESENGESDDEGVGSQTRAQEG